MSRDGGCFCGAIRYRVTGEALTVAHCHCIHCRRTNAAAFVTWAEFRSGDFAWMKGTPATYATRPRVVRTFCRDCGTQITFQSEAEPASIDVTVCSLDDPDSIAPQHHVWTDRKLSWVGLDDGLPRHALKRP
jgi:hypothetical protein